MTLNAGAVVVVRVPWPPTICFFTLPRSRCQGSLAKDEAVLFVPQSALSIWDRGKKKKQMRLGISHVLNPPDLPFVPLTLAPLATRLSRASCQTRGKLCCICHTSIGCGGGGFTLKGCSERCYSRLITLSLLRERLRMVKSSSFFSTSPL